MPNDRDPYREEERWPEERDPYRDRDPLPDEAERPLGWIPSTQDDRTMALLCHLGGLFTGFVMPLVIWLIKKDQSRFVDDQGKEALNFQITLLIQALILVVITIVTCGIGGLLFLAWAVYAIVMPILACVRSKNGEAYRYPLTFRIIK